jgi:hypothetical protein
MPNKIKLRRSYTAGAVPLTSDLETNEVAINFADSKLYVRTPQNTIQAITLGGSGGSGEDALLRALFVPPAPTSLTATAGNAQVALSWTAPTVLSVTPITDYVVQFSSNSGSTWTTFSDGTSTTASATVTGLTNGTAYVFRVAAVNGVGQGAYSTASSSVTPSVPVDPFFASVALLLHADGTGSTFVDSSPTPKAITAYGNATQSATQSRWGGKSAYFDGSGDYLTVPAIPLGDNFAIECWVYPVSRATTLPCIWGNYNNYASGALALFAGHLAGNNSRYQLAVNGGSFPSVQSASDIIYGAWSHIAVVRNVGTLTLYINGVTEGSMSVAGMTFGGVGSTFAIGLSQDNPSANFYGYVDDFRVTLAARYSGTTITVPTAAFPDA